MKIKVFSFQGVRKGIPFGTVKGVLPIVEALNVAFKKEVTYYLGFSEGYLGNINVKELSKFYFLLSKIISVVNRTIIHLPDFKIRYFNEKLFDLFASFKIKEPSILISTAYLCRTLQKNKDLGGINIFIAYNPDDFEINAILKKEKELHKAHFQDAYTYEKRIKFVSNSTFLYDHIVTATISEYESYIKRLSKNKISFIESHILPNQDTFPNINFKKNNELTFCYVAHPFWLKGLIYLLEAWSKINSDGIKLCIAGSIDEQLQKIIKERFLTLKNVEYLGWVSDLNQFFRTSHVCIVPSLLDAGPATVAEAMCCNLPIIVSHGCGARTLIKEGVNGFVVPAGNSDMIYEKIKWFINNEEKIKQMGKESSIAISELAKSDQSKIVAEHLLNVINKLQKK